MSRISLRFIDEFSCGPGSMDSLLLEAQRSYQAYVGEVTTPVQGEPSRFDTHFLESNGSTWVHGWDLVLAVGEAVGRCLEDGDGIRGVEQMKLLAPVHGNLGVRVSEGETERPDGTLVEAKIRTSRGRLLSAQAASNGLPLERRTRGPIDVSPIIATALPALRPFPSPVQTFPTVPPALFSSMDFDHQGAYLSEVFTLFSLAASRTIDRRNSPGTLIAGVRDLRLPRFSTFSNPRTEIHSTLEGEPWSSKRGMQMQSVRSTFIAPRNGPDGSCVTTFALPTEEQWEALPD